MATAQEAQKFWVDKLTQKVFFVLFAKNLSYPKGNWILQPILTGCPGLEDFKLQESHRFGIEEAILQESESFEVKGRFNTCNLTPQTFYKVSFIIRMEKNAHGWEDPVNLRLVHPDGREEERKEKLKGKPENKWMEILVGTFTTFIDAGEIEFSMYEFGKRKKKGLAIFAAFIQPLPFRNN
ncbi:hypothetical protein Patl1_11889 [Pistacia atlantica]|uniref:Uncharacterized protein n=1 Tax=Pistacia atlantica TaxID=434234 RepID=A0ACC1A613_9ROSI|nr:hypothetical protein Patl1_11889 [Pistacia atlantica]